MKCFHQNEWALILGGSSGFGLASAKKLYDFRLPLYVNYADEIIDVDFRSADEIALQIQEMINASN